MPGAAVGMYCAVGYRFDLLVSTRTLAARESQAVLNHWAETQSTRLGALNLGSVEGWQREPENGAARPRCVRPQYSAVGIEDGAAYRQASTSRDKRITRPNVLV